MDFGLLFLWILVYYFYGFWFIIFMDFFYYFYGFCWFIIFMDFVLLFLWIQKRKSFKMNRRKQQEKP
jgi:hypothetical protein